MCLESGHGPLLFPTYICPLVSYLLWWLSHLDLEQVFLQHRLYSSAWMYVSNGWCGISTWMSKRHLKFNNSNWPNDITTVHSFLSFSLLSFKVMEQHFFSCQANNFDVILDPFFPSNETCDPSPYLSDSAFIIWPVLSSSAAIKTILTLRPDDTRTYLLSLLLPCPILKTAAWAVLLERKSVGVTCLLETSQWFPIPCRVNVKVLTTIYMTFMVCSTARPSLWPPF